ncbi:MAG TPA: alpha/beta fold hydrolase [Gemmatimonadales bacterium]|jgi:proline iminopeptidase|nr:alpha/beta fold hydrolase [Gemmatimonadales bacterium]
MSESTAERRIRGVTLFERRVGSGPPTVVLHGGPGAHHDYLLPGFDRLATRRTLIYYDQRGGGRSPVPREVPVGWREQVEDLEALRVLWGIERLSIAGYSWGGLLALLYAVEHPDRIERLGLVSSAPVWRQARVEFERRLAERNAAPEILEARRRIQDGGLRELSPAEYRQKMFELSVAGYFHDWRRAADLTPFRITGRTQQEVWESLGDFDLRPGVAALRLPAVVLHGEDDPIPIATAELLSGLLGAPLERIPDCGHVPYVEAPEQFTRVLDAFLPGTI